jgi:type I restriction enzyme M protein
MNVAHEIGEANCTIYSQDISQKSTGMLRLNLILNNLVHSIQNIVQGNTLEKPAFKEGGSLKKFDYIVSNPPFKLDFSETRDNLDTPANSERFFAGIPTVPNKKKDSMAIYLLFVQHIIFSLSPKGKAAIVVPTGFLTAENSIVSAIRKKIIEMEILTGVISMPSNIFATTGTNVSVLILDRKHVGKSAILMDATELGSVIKEGKAQKTVLSDTDNQLIIDTFNKRQNVEHFAHLVDFEKIISKNYSFSPSQYASSWDASTIARGTSQESLELEISETLKEYKELDDENLRLQKSLAKTLKDLGYDL